MATTNLSHYDKSQLPDASHYRIGFVVSEWNHQITDGLLRGAMEALTDCGLRLDNITVHYVPGSFELPMGAIAVLENKRPDAVICLGSIIRGETPHFEFVSMATSQGIMDVGIKYKKPVIMGVLTDNNIEQSIARSGGALGNKGVEAAITAIKMIGMQRSLENAWV